MDIVDNYKPIFLLDLIYFAFFRINCLLQQISPRTKSPQIKIYFAHRDDAQWKAGFQFANLLIC